MYRVDGTWTPKVRLLRSGRSPRYCWSTARSLRFLRLLSFQWRLLGPICGLVGPQQMLLESLGLEVSHLEPAIYPTSFGGLKPLGCGKRLLFFCEEC